MYRRLNCPNTRLAVQIFLVTGMEVSMANIVLNQLNMSLVDNFFKHAPEDKIMERQHSDPVESARNA